METVEIAGFPRPVPVYGVFLPPNPAPGDLWVAYAAGQWKVSLAIAPGQVVSSQWTRRTNLPPHPQDLRTVVDALQHAAQQAAAPAGIRFR